MRRIGTESRNYKWGVLGLLFVTYFLLQGMRQLYSASIPQIRSDFSALGVTALSLGLVGTVFSFVYGLAAPCASVVADLFRRKAVIVAGCLLFSAGVFLAGFAHSLLFLLVTYGVVNALGQSMVPSSSSAVVSEYHEKTRATALSIYQSALYLGIVAAAVFAGRLGSLGPGAWRWGFWILGGFGLVWSVVLLLLLWERPVSASVDVRPSFGVVLRAFFGCPSAIFLMLAFGALQFGDNGLRVWMTTYLADRYPALSSATAAFHAVFWYYVGAFAGINVAGRLSDRLAARQAGARFAVAATGLAFIVPCVVLAVRTRSLVGACLGLFLWGVGGGIYDSNLFAPLHDVVDSRFRAAATGLFLGGGFLIGCASPLVLGFIGDRLSMTVGMTSLGGFYLLGSALVLIARHCHLCHLARNGGLAK